MIWNILEGETIRGLIIMIIGLPATGKSTIAKNITSELKGTLLRTDLIRKQLLKKPRYSKKEKDLIYGVMLSVTNYLTSLGETVILDGTFYKRSTREKVYRMANENQINLRIVECCCPVEVIKRRMNRRKRNKYPLSQADYETYKKISAQFDAIRREHIIVDTSNFLRSSITEVIYKLRKDMD
jgi:hypothetical protein|tara:strand:+ start:3145 stop:3693 length:549 start_codon:yes stop_codon:yes gene_type:complete